MIGSLAPMTITIGEHVERTWLGLTFNMDTIWSTLAAGAILLVLAFVARRQLTKNTEDHVPTKLQILWETIVSQVNKQVEDNLGKVHPFVAPLAVSLFFFILIANWLEFIPTELNSETHLLPSPTADTNLTYAMAIMAMVGVWGFGIRQNGLKAYLKHFFEPVPWMFPLEILQELLKPVTLALRLFGNIFAGGIMLALLGELIAWAPASIPVGGVVGGIFTIVWKGFDTLFLGALQAFIFALLTVLYFGMATGGHSDDHADEDESDTAQSTNRRAEPATAS